MGGSVSSGFRLGTVLVALAIAGLACGGGGGKGGRHGGSGRGGATAPPAGGAGNDFEPPEVSIATPPRGASFSQEHIAVRGHASDAASGIATLAVNGALVAPDENGDSQHTLRLDQGRNMIVARAVDLAGNASVAAIGVVNGTFLLDFGNGPARIMEVAVPLEAVADVAIANGAVTFTIGSNTRFEADLLSSAIPWNGLDVERFLTFFLPSALELATQSVAPIPLPALQGVGLTNARVYRDGLRGEFATVGADVS
jgi:hypothetical protein